MSTTHPDKRVRTKRHDSFESMTPREQLPGMLVLVFVLLLAMLLQAL